MTFCATCGRPLDGDLEDEPFGDAGRPICGECNRARNFDAIEAFELDADDADEADEADDAADADEDHDDL